MRATVRHYAAAVALVGSSVIAVSPIAPEPDTPTSPATRLAGSFTNIPRNIFEDVASVPANMIRGLQQLTDALDLTGPWAVYGPSNVLGTDFADPPKYKGAVNFLVPFPELSVPLGEQVVMVAQAEVPMYSKCPWLGRLCTDLPGLLEDNLQVPILDLLAGYTFPTVINPASNEEAPWSGQTVKVEPLLPFLSYFDHLLDEPNGIETVSFGEAVTAVVEFGVAIFDAFNIFVQGSYLYDPNVNPVAFLIPPFLGRILCHCDDPNEKPYPTAPASDDEQTPAANVATLAPAANGLGGEPDNAVDPEGEQRSAADRHDRQAREQMPRVAAATREVESASAGASNEDGSNATTTSEEDVLTTSVSPEGEVSGTSTEDLASASAEPNLAQPADEEPADVIAGSTVETGLLARTGSKFTGGRAEVATAAPDPISSAASKVAHGPQRPGKRVEEPDTTAITSTDLASAGNKVQPRRLDGIVTSPGGVPGGAAESVDDRVSTDSSTPTEGLTSGAAPKLADGGRDGK